MASVTAGLELPDLLGSKKFGNALRAHGPSLFLAAKMAVTFGEGECFREPPDLIAGSVRRADLASFANMFFVSPFED
jgi:hypothetical protein